MILSMPRCCKLLYLLVTCGWLAVRASIDDASMNACITADVTKACLDEAESVNSDAFLQVRSARSSNSTWAVMIDTGGDPTLQNTDVHPESDLSHKRRPSLLSNDSLRVHSVRSAVAVDKSTLLEYDDHLIESGRVQLPGPGGKQQHVDQNGWKSDAIMSAASMYDHRNDLLSQQKLPLPHVTQQQNVERDDQKRKPENAQIPLPLEHSRFTEFVTPTSDILNKLRPVLAAGVLSVCLIFAGLIKLTTIGPSTREEKKEVASMEAKGSKITRGGCDVFKRENEHATLGIEWSELKDVDIGRLIRAYPQRFQQAARRGLPSEYRWQVWKAAVNFTDQEVVPHYATLCAEENQWSKDIREDLHFVFSDAPGFDKEALYRLLNAHANLHPEVGYCQGMASALGHLFWMSHDEEESLGVFRCLMFTLGLSGFYKPDLPIMKVYTSACEELILETLPKLWEHLLREGIEPALYLEQWFLTLFIDCLPLAVLPLVWDNIICNGLPMILSIAVAIFQALEDALLGMRYESLVICLHDLKAYESDPSSVQSFSIGQIISKIGYIELPPRHILEYLPVNHWSGDMEGKCPSGHPMVVFLTPHDKFACDKCRKLVQKDSPLHGCRACNFDMCQSCFSERQMAKLLRHQCEELSGAAKHETGVKGLHVEDEAVKCNYN